MTGVVFSLSIRHHEMYKGTLPLFELNSCTAICI